MDFTISLKFFKRRSMEPVSFDVKGIFAAAGIKPLPVPGVVLLYERMEVPEQNPHDEWITLGLVAMNELASSGFNPKSVADVGTGNGILSIGLAHIFMPSTIYLTDIVEGLLGHCKKNLENNLKPLKKYHPLIILKSGRDAEPLPDESFDLVVFSPPPLMVKNEGKLSIGLSRTTLIEFGFYSNFARNKTDPLLRWSVLPWYAFLEGVKKKIKKNGFILGLYSGRVPFKVIEEAYKRAGLKLRVVKSIIKKQQDARYLAEYAEHEENFLEGETFDFYKYDDAKRLMESNGLEMPGVVDLPPAYLKEILKPARISAVKAFELSKKGLPVAHIGHALLGF